MQQRDELLLHRRLEIDEEIATTDHVEPGERRVADQALLREHDGVAQLLVDLIAVLALDEESRQPLGATRGRRSPRGRYRCAPSPVPRHRRPTQTPAGDSPSRPPRSLRSAPSRSSTLPRRLRRRVPRRAAGTSLSFAATNRRITCSLQDLPRRRLAEEAGHVDQQILEQRGRLRRVVAQHLHVLGQLVEVSQAHAALNAPPQSALLVAAEIEFGARAPSASPTAVTRAKSDSGARSKTVTGPSWRWRCW